MKMDKNVRCAYLRDPKNPKRVLTLVRKLEGKKLTVAWAMNTPRTTNEWLLPPDRGDTFEKKLGRRIALGRLENSSLDGVKATVVTSEGDYESQTHYYKVETTVTDKRQSLEAALKSVLEKNEHIPSLKRIVTHKLTWVGC